MKKKLNELVQQYLYDEPNEVLRQEINKLLNTHDETNFIELAHRLEKNLEFGTAGLRGVMQAGYSCMNHVTVFMFAIAVYEYFCSQNKPKLKVVVGFDARLNSNDFATEIARILTLKGCLVYIFDRPIPTPLCAFATKYYEADIGLMVTASHNPKIDNGIKVFDKNAMQMDKNILNTIAKFMNSDISRADFWKKNQKIEHNFNVSQEVFDAYFAHIKSSQLLPKEPKNKNIAIVYTALHGVGEDFFVKALAQEGYYNIVSVPEQALPDGNFPTVVFPNPEEEHTLDYAYDLALKKNINLVFANDPDADRLQVSFLNSQNKFEKLSGNQMGVILGYFAIKNALENGIEPIVATSIASSRMLKKIADTMGAVYKEALTGFGNIAQVAFKAVNNNNQKIVFTYEEAIGFLVGDMVLDKDGIISGVRFMEVLAYLDYKQQNIEDFLFELKKQFGVFKTLQWHIRFHGFDADEKMCKLMKKIRLISSNELADNLKINNIKKYDLQNSTGPYEDMHGDVVIFENEDDFRLIIRPSGTEPKIKFYLETINNNTDGDIKILKQDLCIKNQHYKESIEKLFLD